MEYNVHYEKYSKDFFKIHVHICTGFYNTTMTTISFRQLSKPQLKKKKKEQSLLCLYFKYVVIYGSFESDMSVENIKKSITNVDFIDASECEIYF